MPVVIGDLLDLSHPPDFGGRAITAIHLHHEGGGDETDDAHRIEDVALSRTDQHFARIPYHLVVTRPILAADGLPVPLPENPWRVTEGRPLRLTPASVKGHNEGAVAIVVAGRWDKDPLPAWALDRIVEACVWICMATGLGADDIHGHRELAPTLCPGYDPALVRVAVAARLSVLRAVDTSIVGAP